MIEKEKDRKNNIKNSNNIKKNFLKTPDNQLVARKDKSGYQLAI
jgi:hypothetical protein